MTRGHSPRTNIFIVPPPPLVKVRHMLWHEDDLALRRLTPADAPLLAKWLSDPRVLEYYEGRDHPFDEAAIRAKFIARNESAITQCVVLHQGAPLGYVQFYPLDAADLAEYAYPPGLRAFGMDLFIGEPEQWGRGLGTRLVAGVVGHLIAAHGAQRVTLDPHVDNPRAIRCYEKAGFRIVRLLPRHELHEGKWRDCWLMERAAPPALAPQSSAGPTA